MKYNYIYVFILKAENRQKLQRELVKIGFIKQQQGVYVAQLAEKFTKERISKIKNLVQEAEIKILTIEDKTFDNIIDVIKYNK